MKKLLRKKKHCVCCGIRFIKVIKFLALIWKSPGLILNVFRLKIQKKNLFEHDIYRHANLYDLHSNHENNFWKYFYRIFLKKKKAPHHVVFLVLPRLSLGGSAVRRWLCLWFHQPRRPDRRRAGENRRRS